MENRKWMHNPRWDGKFSWLNSSFLVLTPLLTLLFIPWQIYEHGLSPWDLAIFALMTFASGLSITAGYHRLFSHQTFEASGLVKFFFLFFGAGAFQNSAFKWCSDHRYHHRFVDKEGDPYNISKGFFHAHMGWIFYNDPSGRSFDNAKDLAEDRLVSWQHKYYLPLAVLSGFLLPGLLGWLVGRSYAGFLWGGLFRVVFVHHGTFFINSLAHTFGTRPYSTKNSARDCWWLAFLTNGEGFHNFHHAFANDYRNGLRWYHWDPSKWLILTLHGMGLSKNLQRTPEAHILRAKLEASLDQFRHGWQNEIPQQLEAMKQAIESRLQEFQQKFKEFQAWKEQRDSARWRRVRARYWRKRLKAEARALETAVNEYGALLRLTLSHGSLPALA
jgi:stearoyl-CoA desaturase (delta-9 desaturase)